MFLIQPMDSLLEECGVVSVWEQSDSWWAISDLLRACGERWVVLLTPGPWPQHKAELPWGHLLPPHPPEQWRVPVLCGIWACWDRAHGHSWTLSNTKIWAGSSPAPFPDISIEKGLSYRGFLTHLNLSFPLLSGGQVFITQALASLIPQIVYMSKKTREPHPGWHLRNPAAG